MRRVVQKCLRPLGLNGERQSSKRMNSLPSPQQSGGKSNELQSQGKPAGPIPLTAKSIHKPAQGLITLGFCFLTGKVGEGWWPSHCKILLWIYESMNDAETWHSVWHRGRGGFLQDWWRPKLYLLWRELSQTPSTLLLPLLPPQSYEKVCTHTFSQTWVGSMPPSHWMCVPGQLNCPSEPSFSPLRNTDNCYLPSRHC
jgi:hypothetical protein